MKNDRKSLCPEFEKQTSQELEKILHTELKREQPDREIVLQILNILETRDSEIQAVNELPVHTPHQGKVTWHWLKTAVAAVALILIFTFAAPPVFGAENIVELVGRWTQDLFALFRSDSPDQLQTEYVYKTSNPDLQKIYDAVVERGVTQRVVPTWVPEGCVLEELEITGAPEGMNLYALFSGNNHYIILSLRPATAISSEKYPKDDVNVKAYEIEETVHYILPNNDVWTSVWTSGDIGCSLITSYDEETLRLIIQSIYMEGN